VSEATLKFLSDFIKGLFIGIGAVAPGVSGGALAVIFGIYEKITDAIADVFKDFRKNVIFFFPIALGGGVGVLAFSKIMKYLFQYYDVQVKYLFIGLMLGTLPSLLKQANKKGFKRIYILPCIIAFGLTLLAIALEKGGSSITPEIKPGLLQLAAYGAIIGIGTIVPGISASFVLMYIGAYQVVLEGIANIELAVLMPVGIGFVVSIILFAKLISLLFKRIYGYTYYAVLGFVMGSVIAIFPGFAFGAKYLISIFIFAAGFYLSLTLSNYTKEK
jgi:putative membrane protein